MNCPLCEGEMVSDNYFFGADDNYDVIDFCNFCLITIEYRGNTAKFYVKNTLYTEGQFNKLVKLKAFI